MQQILVQQVWLALVVWGIIYLTDYYLTIYTARLYQTHLKNYIVFEGSFELTPVFQQDVNALRWLSPRFLFIWIMSLNLLWLVWFLSVKVLDVPWLFSLLFGGLFLREAAVHLRHMRNLALSRFTLAAGGLAGQIQYARRLILRLSAVELLSFAGFCFLITLALGSPFFLGGVISCFYTGLQHWVMSNKQLRT